MVIIAKTSNKSIRIRGFHIDYVGHAHGRLFKQAAVRSGSLADAAASRSRRWFSGKSLGLFHRPQQSFPERPSITRQGAGAGVGDLPVFQPAQVHRIDPGALRDLAQRQPKPLALMTQRGEQVRKRGVGRNDIHAEMVLDGLSGRQHVAKLSQLVNSLPPARGKLGVAPRRLCLAFRDTFAHRVSLCSDVSPDTHK